MTDIKKCECELCEQNRTFQKHLSLIPEDQRPYFEAVYDHHLETSADLDYHRAVMSGVWSSAVEVLEHALVKARDLSLIHI